MTFTYEGADLSTTIKTFSQNGFNFHIEYMDGSENNYYCSNDLENERLINLMLEQIKLRDEKMNLETLSLKESLIKFTFVLSSCLNVLSISRQKDLISLISLLIAIISLKDLRTIKKRIAELKKYRLFIDMMEELKTIDISKLLECVEFDHMYQIPLDLCHIDEYSYGDMKRIRKNLDKLKDEE